MPPPNKSRRTYWNFKKLLILNLLSTSHDEVEYGTGDWRIDPSLFYSPSLKINSQVPIEVLPLHETGVAIVGVGPLYDDIPIYAPPRSELPVVDLHKINSTRNSYDRYVHRQGRQSYEGLTR